MGIIATENLVPFNETDDYYEPWEDKVWQIWVPKGCRMIVTFQEFDLDSTPNCTKDYFTIQTQKDGEVQKYCGGISSIPTNMTLTHRRAQFSFHSDGDDSRMGVYATYCLQRNNEFETMCDCSSGTSRKRTIKGSRRYRSSASHGKWMHRICSTMVYHFVNPSRFKTKF